MRRMIVKAYDETGDRRVDYMLEIGDVIEWKRDGSTGFQRGRVTALQPSKVCVEPDSGSRRRWIGLRSIMHVYFADGQRKPVATVPN